VRDLTPQTPVVRRSLAVAGDPATPAKGWALTPEAASDEEAPGIVSTHGPGVRIASSTPVTVFRPQWKLSGDYTVSALFQRADPNGAVAVYGLTVGGESGMAFLVRSDGAFAIGPVTGGRRAWSAVALRADTALGPGINRLSVRVGVDAATFVVNGVTVGSVPINPGALDGVAGVHVAGESEVIVAAFGVSGASTSKGRQ
jgi:uncharacterized protein GlcG (DUF336 family)